MQVTIKKEHTGKHDYFHSTGNLLTKALNDKGFKDVYIQPAEWNGRKYYLWGRIKIRREGKIGAIANNLIMHLSINKKDVDTTFNIEI